MLQPSGCYYSTASDIYGRTAKHCLPQVKTECFTTVLSTASRTTLKQTFSNFSNENIPECVYTFPLYEGVSVVGFDISVGSRVLRGLVKEKNKAKGFYDRAVAQGELAGLLEQLTEASDVFETNLGNIAAGETVHVDLTYVGELKHDAEANGIRFTLPTAIAPRYGPQPRSTLGHGSVRVQEHGGIEITVDVNMPEESLIQGIQSPSHPIAVTLGRISSSTDATPRMHRASATLSSASTELDQDFVLILQVTNQNTPKALLETHPTIPNQRALLVTLVPNFSLQPSHSEIVFVVDRSGSMSDNIPTLKSALQVFLKSLPIGVKFNICSFGTYHSFLWNRSKAYSHDSLQEAMRHVDTFDANLGGTEMSAALKATIENRFVDLTSDIFLLTDGAIWDQNELFTYLSKEVKASTTGIRVFTLGIGRAVSHALVEGLARAGNGFAQTVGENEKFDNKVVRMLKGALSPHLRDCEMEIRYEALGDSNDDVELLEKVTDSLRVRDTRDGTSPEREAVQKPISFYEEAPNFNKMETPPSAQNADADPYAHLPAISTPKLLQTPSTLPSLFPFSRTMIYVLLSKDAVQRTPTSIVLRASSSQGPIELTVPVEQIQKPGETIHQLAARKTIQELEEGRGWIFDSRDESGALLREKFPGRFEEMVEREGVRLGTQFQVSGKWLAFVAVAENDRVLGLARISCNADSDDFARSSTVATPFASRSSPFTASQALQFSPQQNRPFGGPPQSVRGGELFGGRPLAGFRGGSLFTRGAPSRSRGGGLFGAQSPTGSRGGSLFTRGAPSESTGGGLFGASSATNVGTFSPFGAQAAASTSDKGGLFNTSSFFGGGAPPPHSTEPRMQEMNREYSRKSYTTTPTYTSDEILHSLIALQTFAGFWEATDSVFNIMGIPSEKLGLENRATGAGGDAEHKKNAWVTLLVVRFLEMYMQGEKDVWELVVDKARAWLGETGIELEAKTEVDRVLKDVKG